MKRKSSLIISLLLALTLLCGCSMPAAYGISSVEEEPESTEYIHFDDIEYIRPDIDETYTTVMELQEALKNPFRFKDVISGIEAFYSQVSNFDTMYSLMNIYRSANVYDSFYEEEYNWLLETSAEYDFLVDDLYASCADSIHAFWLEPLFFWEGFRDEYANPEDSDAEDEGGVSYAQLLELNEREAELLAEYRRLAAERIVEIGGQEVLLDEYLSDADFYEYEAAMNAYYEKYNPLLAQVYIELVGLRREYAELWGWDSYAAMEYENTYGRDYDPDKAELFMERIKYWMIPLSMEIEDAGLNDELWYSPVGEHELMLYLETAAEGFGDYMEEAFDFMEEYGMYDLRISETKANTSFQSYLSDYSSPYLFLDPVGDSYDVITLAHEFGHYVDCYISDNSAKSMDLAEAFSQSMQYLFIEELESVMALEELENLRRMNLLDSLDTFLYQTAQAEFEQRVYEMEELSPQALNELFFSLMCEYNIFNGGNETKYAMMWIDTPHLFESPFYVISYAVSASAALELYELEQEEYGLGTEAFILMSESCLYSLGESLEYAGLQDDLLSESRVRHNAELLRRKLLR